MALPQRLVEYFARHLLVSWSCRRPRGEGNVKWQLVSATVAVWQRGCHSRAVPYPAPEAAEVASLVAFLLKLVDWFVRHVFRVASVVEVACVSTRFSCASAIVGAVIVSVVFLHMW